MVVQNSSMDGQTWIGSIFIKDEGGFEIIMRALNHYNRRLHHISEDPGGGRSRSNVWIRSRI